MANVRSLLKARYVDDGMYCCGWWIEEEDGKRFAEAWSEADANEIVNAVNTIRKVAQRVQEIVKSDV